MTQGSFIAARFKRGVFPLRKRLLIAGVLLISLTISRQDIIAVVGARATQAAEEIPHLDEENGDFEWCIHVGTPNKVLTKFCTAMSTNYKPYFTS